MLVRDGLGHFCASGQARRRFCQDLVAKTRGHNQTPLALGGQVISPLAKDLEQSLATGRKHLSLIHI